MAPLRSTRKPRASASLPPTSPKRVASVARALVANSSTRLRRDDALDLFREPDGDYPRVATGHVPSVFTAEQAAWLDRAVAGACRRAAPVRSLLLLVAIKAALSFQPMSMLSATDAAAGGDFDRASPRRLDHDLGAREKLAPDGIWRLAERVKLRTCAPQRYSAEERAQDHQLPHGATQQHPLAVRSRPRAFGLR